ICSQLKSFVHSRAGHTKNDIQFLHLPVCILQRDRIGLIIQLVLFTIILVGNLSVIIALLSRNVKNQMRFFIINLAASDLFVALGGTLAQIVENITVQFFAPAPICKLVKYMGSAITYSSSFALIILSIDRAEAVCRPLRVSSSRISSRSKARLMISVAWMAAGLCGIPALVLSEKVSETCRFNFKRVNVQTYMVAIALTVFIIPACIIAACHVLMVVTIWRASKIQLRSAAGDPTGGRKSITSTGTSNDLVPKRSRLALSRNTIHNAASGDTLLQKSIVPPHHSKGGCISRAKVKTVKMTCVIVTVYIVCWCPFMVWNLVNTYVNFSATAPHLSKYTPHIQHLVTLNSAANPIIFWIFNAGSIKRNKNPSSL
ncbi:Cardioacceleratory peptide receptor, partial [Fasciolopsis buskii]